MRIRWMSGSGPMPEDKVHADASWRVSTGVFAGPYLQGPSAKLYIFRLASMEMAQVNDAAPQRTASERLHISALCAAECGDDSYATSN
jgi:hypothetical protein